MLVVAVLGQPVLLPERCFSAYWPYLTLNFFLCPLRHQSQSEPPQQRMGGQAQFKKAKSPGVGRNDLRRQLQERKSRERSTGPGDGAVAAQANAKAKAAKANASAKKAAFKKKLSEGGTKDAESSGER